MYYVRNVNAALAFGIKLFADREFEDARHVTSSRAGDTIELNDPFMTLYEKPAERVLCGPLAAHRDANPFFHLFETLWLLAGRRDVKFVATINKRMAEYSDDGQNMQGAYGWRWKHGHFGDQISALILHLKEQPDSRRAVLAMWDPDRDLWGWEFATHNVGGIKSKDIPCNTHVYLKLRNGKLRLTVCCRSNDMIWGAYGANAVHFSILQEYIAAKLGVEMGPLFQLSDSLHVYTGGAGGAVWERLVKAYREGWTLPDVNPDPYGKDIVPMSMGCANPCWDADLRRFFMLFDMGSAVMPDEFETSWWRCVAVPLWNAWKFRDPALAEACVAGDWRMAAIEWLTKHPGKEA